MDMGGEKLQVRHGEEVFETEGIKTHEKREIKFYPKTSIGRGDWVLSVDSEDTVRIIEWHTQVYDQKPFALVAKYETKAEYEERIAAKPSGSGSPVFNIFGPTYGSAIGTQSRVEFHQTFDFRELEAEIDERGGEDIDALKEMVREIKRVLETQDSIGRGRFVEFSELMNRHAWITGPIAQLLMVYAIAGQIT